MASPTRREFARLLGRLDGPALTRFLAALWTARDRPAETVDGRAVLDGGLVVGPHAPPRGLPARLAVSGALRTADAEDVDAVVTTRPAAARALRDRDVRALGPADLRRALLYDLDRSTARSLAADHLDHPLDGPVRSPAGRARAAFSGAPAAPVAAALAVLVVAALLVSSVGSAPTAGGARDGPIAADSGPADAGAGVAGNGTAVTPGLVRDADLAPGVAAAGVVDADELARAHADALRGRAYRLEVVYRETAVRRTDEYVTAVRTRTVRVESETEYRDVVDGWGRPRASPVPDRRRAVYADGSSRYVRTETNGTPAVDRYPISFTSDGARYFADRAAAHVRRVAAADDTDVVGWVRRGDARLVRLVVRDDGREGLANLRGSALVAPSGLVAELRVTYTLPAHDRAASLTLRYAGLDATTVDPPAWSPSDRNATSTRGTATPVGYTGV